MEDITTVNLIRNILRQSIMLSDSMMTISRRIQQLETSFSSEESEIETPYPQTDECMLYGSNECPICYETVDEALGTYTYI